MPRENIENYVKVRDVLNGLGLDVETHLVESLNVLRNLKENNFDSKNVIADLSEEESLKSRLDTLRKEVTDFQGKSDKIAKEISKAQAELEEKQEPLKLARMLDETGLDVEGVKKLRDTVVRVTSIHGLTPAESLTLFEKDILDHYDAALGLEPKIGKMKADIVALEGRIADLKERYEEHTSRAEERLNDINDERSKRETELGAYTRIRERGVSDRTIGINTLLESVSIDEVWQTIKEIADLRNVVDGKKEELRLLEGKFLPRRRKVSLDSRRFRMRKS